MKVPKKQELRKDILFPARDKDDKEKEKQSLAMHFYPLWFINFMPSNFLIVGASMVAVWNFVL